RLLERFGRANLGLGSARTDGDAQAYTSNVGCRPGNELSLSCGVLENLSRDDPNIEGSSGRGELDQFGRGTEADNKLVASCVLELCGELSHGGRHPAARQDLEFGSLHVGGRRQRKCQTDRKSVV